MSGQQHGRVVTFKSSVSTPIEMPEDREIQNAFRRRRTVSESAAAAGTRIAMRRHSDFDDSWTRNFEPKEDDGEEEEDQTLDAGDETSDFGVARSVPGEEDLEGIFQFSAENSRSNSESATVAEPSDSEDDDDDDDEASVYGDARSRQTSFVRTA